MLEHMEPLFVKHKVNLILSGHNHAYVRSHPMQQGQLDPSGTGPIYLTIGSGGAFLARRTIHVTPEDWVAHRDNTEFGFGDLHVINATHAYFSRFLNKPDSKANPKAQDSVWIRNQKDLGPPTRKMPPLSSLQSDS